MKDKIELAKLAVCQLNQKERAELMRLFMPSDQQPASDPIHTPRLLRRAEVARRLSCSIRNVDRLAKEGLLRKRQLPGRSRASGFLESELTMLLTGGQGSEPFHD